MQVTENVGISMKFEHQPVLLKETIDALNIKPDGIYLDGTLGGGGHSYEIASRLSEKGHLYGIDQDQDALDAAAERLSEYKDKVTYIHCNYREAVTRLKQEGVSGVDGILLDLGVSSYQLDNGERGFSYRTDAPLDMRMDTRQTLTAAEIINTYDETELFRMIKDYGEDKFAKNIAKHIVAARQKKRIETTFELNEIIKAAIPARMRAEGGHPSKRTFQAIRVECNRELEVLSESLQEMIDFLNPAGRFAIITFQSLEDRIVKNAFREAEHPCTCPPGLPVCVCGKVPLGKCIGHKPITATEEEILNNRRSKPAKLRVFEKK